MTADPDAVRHAKLAEDAVRGALITFVGLPDWLDAAADAIVSAATPHFWSQLAAYEAGKAVGAAEARADERQCIRQVIHDYRAGWDTSGVVYSALTVAADLLGGAS